MFLKNYFNRIRRTKRYGGYISDRIEDIIQHTKHASHRMLMCYPHHLEYEILSNALRDEGFCVAKWDRLPADFYAKFSDIVPIMITWQHQSHLLRGNYGL